MLCTEDPCLAKQDADPQPTSHMRELEPERLAMSTIPLTPSQHTAPYTAHVVMVPEAGHYPQSQQPDVTTDAVLTFLETMH